MNNPQAPIPPSSELISALETNGCFSSDWSRVCLHPLTDPHLIHNVEFEGDVEVGILDREKYPDCCLRDAIIKDSRLGNGVRVRYVPGGISGATIGDEARIENCALISYDNSSDYGVGTKVAVLDETGSREVVIYPGLSAQIAMLMARGKQSTADKLRDLVNAGIIAGEISLKPEVGAGARLFGCGPIRNCYISPNVTVDSASSLSNGAIISNSRSPEASAFVGSGVDASDFIIEDAHVSGGVILRRCYVGQGCAIENGFTAHDSLFFANCSMENGEACALFAGPYTVSMHKASLMIGCQTSFMNAGSATNQSNHMYKLGPVHWGILERGVKTSSGSYLMLGAKIGAFSLLMGQHKTHPDSSEFPFSYLFGDARGATVVVPGVMLRSCGLLRDEQKWPKRDRRKEHSIPLFDRVVCDVLNPVTVESMIRAVEIIRPMLKRQADDDGFLRHKGMKLSRASLERALKLYTLGIMKYLDIMAESAADGQPLFSADHEDTAGNTRDRLDWTDIAGLPVPRFMLEDLVTKESIAEMEQIFTKIADNYESLQRQWIDERFPELYRVSLDDIKRGAGEFDRLVALDREGYLDMLASESEMLRL